MLLAVAALMPALGLSLYVGLEERRDAVNRLEERASALHRLAVREEQAALEGVQQLFAGFGAAGGAVLSEQCAEVLARLAGLRYQLALADLNGDVVCPRPSGGPVNFANRGWFRETVATRRVSSGEYVVARITGRLSLGFGAPVFDGDGTLRAVIAVIILPSWVQSLAEDSRLPQSSALTLFTPDGTVLARYPDSESWAGRSIAESGLARTTLAEGPGTYRLTDLDGQERLVSVRLLHENAASPLFLAIGLPLDVAFADLSRVTGRLAMLIGLTTLAFLGVGWGLEVLVLRPVRALRLAATLRSAGDLATRSGLRHGEDEMGGLAQAFDDMADSRERAETELRLLNVTLEHRIADRARQLEAANEEVARERATLLAIMGSMSDGLVVVAPDARIVYASRRAAELLGSPVPLDGKTVPEVRDLVRDGLEDPDGAYAIWEELAATEGGNFDFVLIGPPQRDIHCVVFPVIDPEGHRTGVGSLLSDVSAERDLERTKDEIVAVVSHELRTPLASLVGFADLLLTREYDEDRRRQFLTVIRQEGNRLTSLINDFLDLQRLESGHVTISSEATDLRPLLERARTSAPADAQPRIVLDLPANLPLVRADPDAIHQVVTNLLSNAVKYSPTGGEIRIVARPAQHSVQISVIDHGLGVPADAVARLFDKFFRVDNSDRREIKGTGLGLAICRQIVTAHGGQIWAESEGLGSGTQVHFTLPLSEQPQIDGDVLIVEDDYGFVRLVAEELRTQGFSSTSVGSVESALDQLAAHTPQAILLDLIFPSDRQGESLLAELAGSLNAHIPVFIVTVKDLDAGQQEFLKSLGTRAIFRKGPRVAVDAARAIARCLAEEMLLREGGQA